MLISHEKTTEMVKQFQATMDTIVTIEFDVIQGTDRTDAKAFKDTFLTVGHIWQRDVPEDVDGHWADFQIWGETSTGKPVHDSLWSGFIYDGNRQISVKTPEKIIWIDDPQTNGYGRLDKSRYNPLYINFFMMEALLGNNDRLLTNMAKANEVDTIPFRYGTWFKKDRIGLEFKSTGKKSEKEIHRDLYYFNEDGVPWKKESYYEMVFRGDLKKGHSFVERRNIVVNPESPPVLELPDWPITYNKNSAKSYEIVSLDNQDTIQFNPEEHEKPVIQVFYSYGCPSTPPTMKALNDNIEELLEHYEIYCMSMDHPRAAERLKKEYNLSDKLPIYADSPSGRKAYKVESMMALIVTNGKEVAFWDGHLNDQKVQAMIDYAKNL